MKRRGNASEAMFHHPGKKSESKAVSEDKQQEARSSPALAEVVKQEEEVPLGLRPVARGRGWQRGRRCTLHGRAQSKPLSGHASLSLSFLILKW